MGYCKSHNSIEILGKIFNFVTAGGHHVTDTLHGQHSGKHWDNQNLKMGQTEDN